MTRPSRSALVVSDSAPLRRYTSVALEAGNITCTEAASGYQAMDRLSEKTFSIYVVDLDMPPSDGVAIFAIALMDSGRDPLPVVIGCFRNPDWKMRPGPWSDEKAFAALLLKPFRPDELLAATEAALDPSEA
jgi:CheY-like chemotaxis protein